MIHGQLAHREFPIAIWAYGGIRRFQHLHVLCRLCDFPLLSESKQPQSSHGLPSRLSLMVELSVFRYLRIYLLGVLGIPLPSVCPLLFFFPVGNKFPREFLDNSIHFKLFHNNEKPPVSPHSWNPAAIRANEEKPKVFDLRWICQAGSNRCPDGRDWSKYLIFCQVSTKKPAPIRERAPPNNRAVCDLFEIS